MSAEMRGLPSDIEVLAEEGEFVLYRAPLRKWRGEERNPRFQQASVWKRHIGHVCSFSRSRKTKRSPWGPWEGNNHFGIGRVSLAYARSELNTVFDLIEGAGERIEIADANDLVSEAP